LERRVIRTADGSATLHIPQWQEQYHSIHGALQESRHVYIEKGFRSFTAANLAILEIGFGTGLNALLTCVEGAKSEVEIAYTGVERYPVTPEEWEALDYGALFSEPDIGQLFSDLHRAPWEKAVEIGPRFTLIKRNQDFKEIRDSNAFNLIYYDAFGARVQPDLWTEDLFEQMYQALKPGGCLVTYAAKGSVRRAMQSVGFRVERLPGPPRKREMLRAWKDEYRATEMVNKDLEVY
jgi:tRNA U34 5-methylaminomethyl-2-thiouridine-forming methyltransferase MnmC